MSVSETPGTGTRNIIWLAALALLGLGGLGAMLLTEAAQMVNLPRSWVFTYFKYRMPISLLLVAGTVALWFWHRRHSTVANWVARGYVLAMVACLFFIHLFAPYVWLRAQQHEAVFISVAEANRLLQGDADVLVLEINGGLSERYGIGPGAELRHPALDSEIAVWPCE